MKTLTFFNYCIRAALISTFVVSGSALHAESISDPVKLGIPRQPGSESYRFTTEYVIYSPEGSRISSELATVELDISVNEEGSQLLTCRRFELISAEGEPVSIPQLEGWQNRIDPGASEVLGIPHADFAGLTTDRGDLLPPELSYRVYNTFVDFYAFNNVFGEPSEAPGKDISDLHSIGQVIEHYSAYSKPPVSLVGSVAVGSYFQNGKVTLYWKGMSEIRGEKCSLVEFDSGDSTFRMIVEAAPGLTVSVKGGSQYWGDLYLNVRTAWLERADFREVVMTRTKVGDQMMPDSVIKRFGRIEKL